MSTRKQKACVICYDGIKSRKDGIHTRKQFLQRVNPEKPKPYSFYKSFMSKSKYNELKHMDNVFRKKSLNEKMKERGATWEDRNVCIKKVLETRKKRKAYFNALSNQNSQEFKNFYSLIFSKRP